jgi:deazaflavin-dependent oxidoreductase (nitroreductase family)
MTAQYRLTRWRRVLNWLVRALLRVGLGPRHTYRLTVRGRRSGKLYSTPGTLVEEGDQRWLVAPYGEVGWLRNARAAGEVILSRGRHSETVRIVELGRQESAPLLKRYVTEVPITRRFFAAGPDASVDVFAQEAPRHPVFRVGRDYEPRCLASLDDGSICGEPATVVDPQLGDMVCVIHAPPGPSKRYSEARLWKKLAKYARKAGREVVEKVLWLYFVLQKPETPAWAKATMIGALAYFMWPADALPDVIPAAGYADDLGVLAAAVAAITMYIDADVRDKARKTMHDWFG